MMVLNRGSKSRKFETVNLDYIIHILEIKPWTKSSYMGSSMSLVFVKWKYGDTNTGSTNIVVPFDEEKVEFNESFKLTINLSRDISKEQGSDKFEKCCVQFELHESQRSKGPLATTTINLAKYGIIRKTTSISAAMSTKKSFSNTFHPVLHIKIEAVDDGSSGSSSRSGMLPKSSSFGRHESDSGSVFSEEEFVDDNDDELASLSDDDTSPKSSLTNESLVFHNEEESTLTGGISSGFLDREHEGALLTRASSAGYETKRGAQKYDKLTRVRSIGPLAATISRSGWFKGNPKLAKDGEKKHPEAPLEHKVQQLENKMKLLEEDLLEVSFLEIALYSIVPEHGCSRTKVHAPARRLARFYIHACNEGPQNSGSAARTIVSGMILVLKACGNDVSRLTFWLSNCVLLRALIAQTVGIMDDTSQATHAKQNMEDVDGMKRHSMELVSEKITSNDHCSQDFPCMDSQSFISTLKGIETWIFTRLVKQLWWQVFVPCMRSVSAKMEDRPLCSCGTKDPSKCLCSCSKKKGKFTTLFWNATFKDARDRLCPVRAEGNECGCFLLLSRMAMEQCVAKLDVAMFNAILRESLDEIPTDPVSDPICDPVVLPVPAGKPSFGAGAQLKNVIVNWTKCLTDLFGPRNSTVRDQNCKNENRSQNMMSFCLLSALSDLMMLPKSLLLSSPTTKELCPLFGASLIRKVLKGFIQDEFSPDPIPEKVFRALNAQASFADEGMITSLPCVAPAVVYTPPSEASINRIMAGPKTQTRRAENVFSLMLKKSTSSDDELDELFFPPVLGSINEQISYPAIPVSGVFRYELLKDLWARIK